MKILALCETAGNELSWCQFPAKLRGGRILSGSEQIKEASLGIAEAEVSQLVVGKPSDFAEFKLRGYWEEDSDTNYYRWAKGFGIRVGRTPCWSRRTVRIEVSGCSSQEGG